MIPPDIQTIFSAIILAGLIFAAAAIPLVPSWRLALFSLAIQYALITLVLASFVQFPIAILRMASGLLALMIFYVTLRRVEEMDRAHESKPFVFHVGFPFRVIAVAFVLVSITGFVTSSAFLGLPTYLVFSSLWLVTAGILVSVLSRDASWLGMGILLFTGGISLLDMAMERSLFLYGLINISDLLLALLVAHLATLPKQSDMSGHRRGEPQ